MFITHLLAIFALLILFNGSALLLYMMHSDLFGSTRYEYRTLKAIDFAERNVLVAEHQPEYLTLPANVSNEPTGEVVCCWQFSYMDRLKVLFTGKLWSSQMTFQSPLQPVIFSVNKSDVLRPTASCV